MGTEQDRLKKMLRDKAVVAVTEHLDSAITHLKLAAHYAGEAGIDTLRIVNLAAYTLIMRAEYDLSIVDLQPK